MNELYYKPLKDEYFKELKEKAISIWSSYDNQFGYADEKINRIKDLPNVSDNGMYIINMFDIPNQHKLVKMLSKDVKHAICKRLTSGGLPEKYDPFCK